jgi:ribosomal-protein-alanine acetyltransferase
LINEQERRPSAAEVVVRPLRSADIESVARIQRQSFSEYEVWSVQAYLTELTNPNAVYLVAMIGEEIVGYGGLWVIMDEAHVTTIAVAPNYRGQRIGERLLVEMLLEAQRKGATRATLEVRSTNEPARRLYEKYGFVFVAIRKGYYQDNNENADILWINDMTEPAWRKRFSELRASLGV